MSTIESFIMQPLLSVAMMSTVVVEVGYASTVVPLEELKSAEGDHEIVVADEDAVKLTVSPGQST